MKGDGLPVEFTVADRQEEMAALVPQYHNKEEKKLQLLSELPWTYAETSQNCPVQKNACANTAYGRLPLAVGHLRYRYGLSMGNHTRIVWKLNGKYRRLSFGYGFDIDAWMPKIDVYKRQIHIPALRLPLPEAGQFPGSSSQFSASAFFLHEIHRPPIKD